MLYISCKGRPQREDPVAQARVLVTERERERERASSLTSAAFTGASTSNSTRRGSSNNGSNNSTSSSRYDDSAGQCDADADADAAQCRRRDERRRHAAHASRFGPARERGVDGDDNDDDINGSSRNSVFFNADMDTCMDMYVDAHTDSEFVKGGVESESESARYCRLAKFSLPSYVERADVVLTVAVELGADPTAW